MAHVKTLEHPCDFVSFPTVLFKTTGLIPGRTACDGGFFGVGKKKPRVNVLCLNYVLDIYIYIYLYTSIYISIYQVVKNEPT